MNTVIRIDNLNKTFARKWALFNLELEIQAGEMVALVGTSGSGKSMFLHHVAGLARYDRDNGDNIDVLGRRLQASGRLGNGVRRLCADIGYIFQQLNLVDRLSVLGNVLLGPPGRIPRRCGSLGLSSVEQKRQALKAPARVGLVDFAGQRTSTLSDDRQRRAAITRALTQKTRVVLADEPIASPDPESTRKAMDILTDTNRYDGKIVAVTLHQVDYVLRYCPRAMALKGGRILFDGSGEHPSEDFLSELCGAEGGIPLLFSGRARRGAESQLGLTLTHA